MANEPWRVLSLIPMPLDAQRAFFEGLGVELAVPASREPAQLASAFASAEIVVGDWTNQVRLTGQLARAAPRLAYVLQPNVGVENIELSAFAARGIPVTNGAGLNAGSVAEWCLGAAISLLRSMRWAEERLRAGRWPRLVEAVEHGCRDLAGMRVGVVGFGPIGVECTRRFTAMGCPVSYWSRRKRPPEEEHGATYRALDALLAESDLLVVVVALGPETRGLLDAERLARLPRGAYLIDAARGGVVDEAALVDAVRSGALGGAALDVFETEPLPMDSPLLGCERILLSPHLAGATEQARARVIAGMRENLRRALAGDPVLNVINGVDPRVRRRT